jgi:hypothetical protein
MSKSQILDWYYNLTEEEVSALSLDECEKVQSALDEDFFTDSLESF